MAKCDAKIIDERLAGRSQIQIATVDLARLDGSELKEPTRWEFLTSGEMNNFLGDDDDAKATAVKKIEEESGGLILVYIGRDRVWPVVHMDEAVNVGDDFAYDTGVFAGDAAIYDITTGKRLCHAGMEVENSDEITFREGRFSSKKAQAENAVFEDFKDEVRDAAMKNVKNLAQGKLKLGYSILE